MAPMCIMCWNMNIHFFSMRHAACSMRCSASFRLSGVTKCSGRAGTKKPVKSIVILTLSLMIFCACSPKAEQDAKRET